MKIYKIYASIITAVLLTFIMGMTVCADEGIDKARYTEGYHIRDWYVKAKQYEDNKIYYEEEVTVEYTQDCDGMMIVVPDVYSIWRDTSKKQDGSKIKKFDYVNYVLNFEADGRPVYIDGRKYYITSDKAKKGEFDTYRFSFTSELADDRMPYGDILYFLPYHQFYEAMLTQDIQLDHFSFDLKLEKPITQEAFEEMSFRCIQMGTVDAPWDSEKNIAGKDEQQMLLEFEGDRQHISGEIYDINAACALVLWTSLEEGYFINDHIGKNYMAYVAIIIAFVLVLQIIIMEFFLRDKLEKLTLKKPPEDTTSAGVGYIIDGKITNLDVISLVYAWLKKGYIGLVDDPQFTDRREHSEKKKNKVILMRLVDALPTSCHQYEHTLFGYLFENGADEANLRDLDRGQFAIVKAEIMDHYGLPKSFWGNTRWQGILCVTACLASFLSIAFNSTSGWSKYTVLGILPAVVTGIAWWYRKNNCARDRFATTSHKIKQIVSLGVSGVIILAAQYICSGVNGEVPFWVHAIFCVLLVIAIAMCGNLKPSSPKRLERLSQIVAFRDYLKNVDIEELRKVAKNHPKYMANILPYAVVFRMTNRFKGMVHEEAENVFWG